ncbi:hypothetical protein B484DRAFT_451672 [Ochromonadaceae sp. CCMP2298]|nr:hypothetical protein B484DRAFT_451672 [Ochromonadaceae sp. CCMP2298]
MLFEGKRADFFTPVLAVEKIIHQLAWVVDNRACMDEHTADQLVIYLALGALTTSALPFRVLCAPRVDGNAGTLDASSLHIEAAAQVASLLTGVRVTVTEQPGGNRLISASLPTGNA